MLIVATFNNRLSSYNISYIRLNVDNRSRIYVRWRNIFSYTNAVRLLIAINLIFN